MQNIKWSTSASPEFFFFNSSHFWQSYRKLLSFVKSSKLLRQLLKENQIINVV